MLKNLIVPRPQAVVLAVVLFSLSLLGANLSFPSFEMDYTLEVAAEPGGVRVSVNLDKPLPEKLAGRAGFNLEFLPSLYVGKTYSVDGAQFGVFPRTPQDPMIKVLPSPD